MSPLDRLLGSLEVFLEPPGALLAASWSLFGRSWGGLGVSWAPLGPSWGGLGASWGLLGASWAALGRLKCDKDNMPQKDQLPDPQTSSRPSTWDSILGPKIDQNRTQNESKIKTIFKNEKVALQEPLGAVLGRKNVPKSVPTIGICENNEDAFFIDLGPTWQAKVPKMNPRWHPKTTPNRSQNDVQE